MTASMNSMSIYALYISQTCVELCFVTDCNSSSFHNSEVRLFSIEKSYYAALDFGRDLAAYKKIPFINHINYVESAPTKVSKRPRAAQPRLIQPGTVCCA